MQEKEIEFLGSVLKEPCVNDEFYTLINAVGDLTLIEQLKFFRRSIHEFEKVENNPHTYPWYYTEMLKLLRKQRLYIEGLLNLKIGKEMFVDIPRYEGLYQCSNYGNIKSLERYVNHPSKNKLKIVREKILKQSVNKYGYKTIGLHNKGNTKLFTVHRLVSSCFIPNPENKPTINHISCCKIDNRVCNLEYNTVKENINHAIANGLNTTSRPVYKIDKNTNKIISYYKTITEASIGNNMSGSHISCVCRGKRKTASGFKWKYVDSI